MRSQDVKFWVGKWVPTDDRPIRISVYVCNKGDRSSCSCTNLAAHLGSRVTWVYSLPHRPCTLIVHGYYYISRYSQGHIFHLFRSSGWPIMYREYDIVSIFKAWGRIDFASGAPFVKLDTAIFFVTNYKLLATRVTSLPESLMSPLISILSTVRIDSSRRRWN